MTPTSPTGTVIARSKTGNRFVTEEPDGLFYVWSPNLNGIGISWTYAFRTKTAAIRQMRRMNEHAPNGISTVTYSMPAHWASYLINGDASGLDDDDIAQADAAIEDIGLGSPVDVSDSDFRRGGDYGSLAGDYADYTFHVIDDAAAPGHTPNEDLAWREVYARAYQTAASRGLEDWKAREEASRAAWADYEARTGQRPNPPLWQSDDEAEYMRLLDRYDEEMSEAGRLEDEGYTEQARIHRRAAEAAERAADRISRRYAANGSIFYVWALARGSNEPLSEGPWGPYETLESAKTFARIGATEGAHDRAVSLGFDPESSGFRIVRRYQARTGERLL